MSCGMSDALEEYKQTIDNYLKAIVQYWEGLKALQKSLIQETLNLSKASVAYSKIPRSIMTDYFNVPPQVAMACQMANDGISLYNNSAVDTYWMWLFSLMHYTNHGSYLIRLFRACRHYQGKILILTNESWQPIRAIHECPAFQEGHAEYLLGLCKLRWGKKLKPGQPLMLVGHFKFKKIKLDKVVQLTSKKLN